MPELVRRALERVEPDARPWVAAHLGLHEAAGYGISHAPDDAFHHAKGNARKALVQFRAALFEEALSDPGAIATLHPQVLWTLSTRLPGRRQHPILTLLLVRLPLQLLLVLLMVFNVAYLGAYFFFNDEVLGAFLSRSVSKLLEGELEMRSVHWNGRLILDLVTGTPHRIAVEDVTVWEPSKSYKTEGPRKTAHAERVDVALVLHQIIPWNRLGVPSVFEIPWVLHFAEAYVHDDFWIAARAYEATNEAGRPAQLLSLREAFVPYRPPPGNHRGLSIEVDDGRVGRSTVDIDFSATAQWRALAELSQGTFDLRFQAPDFTGPPVEMPFDFDLQASGTEGTLDIRGVEVPLGPLRIDQLRSHRGTVPAGDVAFDLTVEGAGSTVDLDGRLFDVFPRLVDPGPQDPMQVQLDGVTPDAGPLVAHLLAELALPPTLVGAEGAAVEVGIRGLTEDPLYTLDGEGLSLDLLSNPAWRAEDVDARLSFARRPPPERWSERFSAEDERNVMLLSALRGNALGGSFALLPDAVGQVVFPDPGEPYLVHLPVRIEGVDPAVVLPAEAKLGATLAGSLRGDLEIEKLVVAPATETQAGGVREADVGLRDLTLVRERGPAQDHIPKALDLGGRVRLGPAGVLDLGDVVIRAPGTRLRADGQVALAPAELRDLVLGLAIEDGPAFARAFGVPAYLATLDASINLFGPLGSPSGNRGVLDVVGLVDAATRGTATMDLARGVLELRASDVHVLGGHGSVYVRLGLFERGQLASFPTLYATADLRDVDLGPLGRDVVDGRADVQLEIGDGAGHAARFADLRVVGTATSDALELGGTTYRGAELAFQLFGGELAVHQLVLPIHRPVSPRYAPRITVPVGRILAEGTITLQDDPQVDLLVAAEAVPLDVVARLLDIESPLRGQIGMGTELVVQGSLDQPSVEGTVALQGLAVRGVLLGSGRLDVTSEDFAAEGPLAAHREVRVRGELQTHGLQRLGSRRRRATRRQDISWTVDAVMAVGGDRAADGPLVDAQLDVQFSELSIPALLRDPADPDAVPPIDGRLSGTSAQVLTCNAHAPMLSDCVGVRPPEPGKRALAIEFTLDDAWVRGVGPDEDVLATSSTDVCAAPDTLCTKNTLQATLEWPRLELHHPWVVASGGSKSAELQIDGSFDLSQPPPTAPQPPLAPNLCRPPALVGRSPAPTSDLPAAAVEAHVQGQLDIRALSGLVPQARLQRTEGRLALQAAVRGPIVRPEVVGTAELVGSEAEPLLLDIEGLGVPLAFRKLEAAVQDGWIGAAGTVEAAGGAIDFGAVSGQHTGYAYAGPCAGRFGLSAAGRVSSQLARRATEVVADDGGGVELRDLRVEGTTAPELSFQRLTGRAVFGRSHDASCLTRPAAAPGAPTTLTLEFTDGITQGTLDCGTVDFERCSAGSCDQVADGWYRIALGGNDVVPRARIPQDAVRMLAGRGQAFAWGIGYFSPTFDRAENTDIRLRLDRVPLRSYDGSGRLAYEAEINSDELSLSGGQPLVLTGAAQLDRARYVKDAIKNVGLLSLTEEVERVESPPPPILQGLRLDLRVETDRPLRVENNLATGVAADLAVDVGGSYSAPEFTGRLEVEPGGTVDVPFLTGTYEIERGRVTLLRSLEEAEVDVVAVRQEPVYIDDQPRRVQLRLDGTLSAIRWGCVAEGDTSGELDSVRACTEYLVLGTGDVQISEADVRRFGGGGLANARKPLQVVGHLTQIDVGERAAEAAPRIKNYIPDVRLRLGQIGPELEIATPSDWFDWDWGRATFGFDYTRGYPGFLLRQSRELSLKLEVLDPITLEFRQRTRSYLNNRIIFDPLDQQALELQFDWAIPSLR